MIRRSGHFVSLFSCVVAVALLSFTPLFGQQQGQGAASGIGDEDLFRLDKAPETPEELWRAARLMHRLGRFDLAQQFLQQFLAKNPDEALLIRLIESQDMVVLNEMRLVEQLREPALEIIRKAEAAARRRARDPDRIARMIDYLSRSRAHRAYAIEQLRAAGADAVPPLVNYLRSLSDGRDRLEVVYVLGRLGTPAVRPLIAASLSGDQALTRDILRALSRSDDERVLPVLRYFAEAPEVPPGLRDLARLLVEERTRRSYAALPSAVSQLTGLARDYYLGRARIEAEPDGTVRIWRWVPGEGLLARSVSPEYARLFLANRTARLALRLDPNHVPAAVLVVATVLEAVPAIETPEGELNWGDTESAAAIRAALAAGDRVVGGVVEFALQEDRPRLATRALRVARELLAADRLGFSSALGGSVERAMRSFNPRVRFSALEAVLSARPVRSFPGSSEVARLLAGYVTLQGEQGELVLLASDPRKGTELADRFSDIGASVRPVSSPEECLSYVRGRIGVGGLIVVLPLRGTEPELFVAALRADVRTRGLPVLVLVEPGQVERWKHLENGYGPTRVSVSPATEEVAVREAEWFVGAAEPLTPEERSAYVERALGWLVEIARGQIPAIEIAPAVPGLLEALRTESSAAWAAEALAYVGRKDVQAALLQVVMNASFPDEVRVAAARAARLSIRRHGLLVAAAPDRLAASVESVEAAGPLAREVELLLALLGPEDRATGMALVDAEPARYREQ